LHGGFVRPPVAAQETRQDVFAQRHQLQGNEQHDEVCARGQKHHPHRREQQQGVILPVMGVLDFEILHGNQHDQRRSQHHDQLEIDGKSVKREPAVKSHVRRFAGKSFPEPDELVGGKAQSDERRHRVQKLVSLLDQEVEQEDGQTEDRQQDFRLDRLVVRRLKESIPHQCVTPETCPSLSRGGRAEFQLGFNLAVRRDEENTSLFSLLLYGTSRRLLCEARGFLLCQWRLCVLCSEKRSQHRVHGGAPCAPC